MPINAAALWTGLFRVNGSNATQLFGTMSGGSGAAPANPGGTRMTLTAIGAGHWVAGGWTLGVQSNGQTSGGTQFWSLNVGRG